jgi:hypothetical protein
MLAADVIGLLRFLSPASFRFWMVCPNALLGAELIPEAHALLLGDDGGFSTKSKIVPKDIAFWRLSASEATAMQNAGLAELGLLVSENELNQFQRRLRACILAYTKGTTFSDVADRLVYACSALEGLLLKNTSEPIQQNLGERMAFLLAKEPDRRIEIVNNVRETYNMRSQYIHHRISKMEETELNMFIVNAHATFFTALKNMSHSSTTTEFIDAIDRLKFGG